MRNKIITNNGYIIATATTPFGKDANADEIEQMLCHQPQAEEGYVYQLRADTLEWELVELPTEEAPETVYTAEQLAEMTNAELSAICSEMGISGSMTKANMIALILDKQNSIA